MVTCLWAAFDNYHHIKVWNLSLSSGLTSNVLSLGLGRPTLYSRLVLSSSMNLRKSGNLAISLKLNATLFKDVNFHKLEHTPVQNFTNSWWKLVENLFVILLQSGQTWNCLFYASPGVISVPLCVCQADNIVPPPRVVTPPVTPVPPRVVLVPIVVVVVSASVIRSIYVCSTLVWIDASSALKKTFFRK